VTASIRLLCSGLCCARCSTAIHRRTSSRTAVCRSRAWSSTATGSSGTRRGGAVFPSARCTGTGRGSAIVGHLVCRSGARPGISLSGTGGCRDCKSAGDGQHRCKFGLFHIGIPLVAWRLQFIHQARHTPGFRETGSPLTVTRVRSS